MMGVRKDGYRIAETFANFAVLWLYAKVFSAKFGTWHPFAWQKRAIHESFLSENCIFHKFTKVSHYTVFFKDRIVLGRLR